MTDDNKTSLYPDISSLISDTRTWLNDYIISIANAPYAMDIHVTVIRLAKKTSKGPIMQ